MAVEPIITLVVHPVNTLAHPTIPVGWRWAVHVGRLDPADGHQCANAGWAPDCTQATRIGETVAAAAVRTARMLGIDVRSGQLELAYDPIPAGADVVNIF